MQTNRRLEALQLLLIVGMFAASAALWNAAPDRLPVHWNLAGKPDRYGGKFEGLLLAPLIALGLYVLMLALPWIDPKRTAYEAFARGYQIIRLAMVALCAAIHATLLLVAFGYRVDVGVVAPLGVGILFCILGNYMGKFRPNWFVGVRTPWTLSSAASWTKTHRLAGRLFIVAGATQFLMAAFHNVWTLALVLIMVAALAIGLPVYSYFVWRHDPDRLAAH